MVRGLTGFVQHCARNSVPPTPIVVNIVGPVGSGKSFAFLQFKKLRILLRCYGLKLHLFALGGDSTSAGSIEMDRVLSDEGAVLWRLELESYTEDELSKMLAKEMAKHKLLYGAGDPGDLLPVIRHHTNTFESRGAHLVSGLVHSVIVQYYRRIRECGGEDTSAVERTDFGMTEFEFFENGDLT